MVNLSEDEWAVLKEMARSLCRSAEDQGVYWTIHDTVIESEMAILKKLGGDFDEFRRQVYLASEPSVDIYKVEEVNPSDHEISLDEYEDLKIEFGIGALEANTWMLNSGPKIKG